MTQQPASELQKESRDAPVVAIDGPSGSGKGTIAHRLATALGFHILDSGALYRLIGLAACNHQVDLADEIALAQIAAELDVDFIPRRTHKSH